MDVFYIIAPGLIIGLGILAALSGLIIFLSCRVFPTWKPASRIVAHPAYKRFFKIHNRIWWIFWSLVIIHAGVAWFYLFG